MLHLTSRERLADYLLSFAFNAAYAGEIESANDGYRDAADIYRQAGTKTRWAIAVRHYGDLLVHQGRLAEAQTVAEGGLELCKTEGWKNRECINSLAHVAHIYGLIGRIRDAQNYFGEANTLERNNSNGSRELYSLRGVLRADFELRVRNVEVALRVTRSNLRICEENGPSNDVALCCWILGRVAAEQGDNDDAIRLLGHAESILRRGHAFLYLPPVLSSIGLVRVLREEWEEAIRLANQALRLSEPRGLVMGHAEALLLRGRALLGRAEGHTGVTAQAQRTELLRALDDLQRARSLAAEMNNPWAEMACLGPQASCHSILGGKDQCEVLRNHEQQLAARLQW